MNFMRTTEGHGIHLELKYCERCGGLWLRPQGGDGVHCASCHVCLAARPDPGDAPPRKRRKARMQRLHIQEETLPSPARIECLQGVAATEVWA
jgi:hypothetical protein